MWLVNVESKTATFVNERGAVIQRMPRIDELVHPQLGYDVLRAEDTQCNRSRLYFSRV
jgi:hypothetical protein